MGKRINQILILAITAILSSYSVLGQEVPPIPQPDVEQFKRATIELVTDRQIVFVVDIDETELDLRELSLDPEQLHNDFGLEITADLSSYIDAPDLPDAVIVAGDIWRQMPEEEVRWLQDTYRKGVVIGLVNLSQIDVRELLSLHCSDMRLLNYDFRDLDFYMVTTFHVAAVFEEDRLAVVDAFEQCRDEDDVDTRGPIQLTIGSAQNTLLQDSLGGVELIATVGLHVNMVESDKFTEEEQQDVMRQLGAIK